MEADRLSRDGGAGSVLCPGLAAEPEVADAGLDLVEESPRSHLSHLARDELPQVGCFSSVWD